LGAELRSAYYIMTGAGLALRPRRSTMNVDRYIYDAYDAS